MIIPNPWLITNYSTADVMITRATQGLGLDYGLMNTSESFTSSDCQAWGDEFSALQICIASSKEKQNRLNAGLFLFLFY